MEEKLYLIRGPRILKQLDEDASYAELEQNTMNYVPHSDKRQYAVNSIQIQNMELVPYAPSAALEVRGNVNSSGNNYQSIILFQNVDFQDEDTNENVTFTGTDGQDYHIAPISLQNNNVKVRCTCLDFRWRFAIHNEKNDVLYGEGPGVYIKKTDRKPNNPRQVPGVCKHLMKLAIELRNSNIVTS